MPAVLGVAAVGGAGTMIVELAAVRLLAPWFGTSLSVWTNVIAVVLLALALGYLAGGRLSGGGRPLVHLGRALCLAAALTALLPPLSSRVADWFVPAELALHDAAGVVLWGSLATSLVLFLPPAFLLGMVAPLAVQAVQAGERRSAGHAGGAVLCTSTLGSLAGVFGTSHLLLPHLGLAATFLVAALALGAAGLAGLFLARGGEAKGGRGRAARPVLGLALVFVAAGRLGSHPPTLGEGQAVLEAAESEYQSVRVVEDRNGPVPLRYLQVNEGFDSFQSVWQPELGVLPEGYYYNLFALPLWWEAERTHWRVLVLGLGAGTVLRVLDGARPATAALEVVGVELDPAVVSLGRRHMELDSVPAEVLDGMDARVALRAVEAGSDLIVLDCYANQVEIPFHLCTREFFTDLAAELSVGGWLTVNLGGFGFEDPVVRAVATTCAAGFGVPVLLARVPGGRNFVLFARRGGDLPVDPAGGLLAIGAAGAELESRLAPLRLPGGSRVVRPPADDADVLTDDRSPVEVLQRRSIREAGREDASHDGPERTERGP